MPCVRRMTSARIDATVQPDTVHIARALELFPPLRDAPPECLERLGRETQLLQAPGESCVLTSGCLLGHIDYAATGIAETAVTLIAVPLPLFELLLARHGPFRKHVFELFGARLADLMLLVEEVAFHRLDQRLALLLARGPALRATHQAIADELGSVREMVSRLLGSFADRGLVQLGREQIDVIDTDGLRCRAGKKY